MKHFNNFRITSFILFATVLSFHGFSQEGQELYKQHCAQCHGNQLEGGNGASFRDGIWRYGLQKGAIVRNVKFGIMDVGMPSFSAILDDEKISTVIDYILNYEKELGVTANLPETLTSQEYELSVQTVAEGLDIPWGISFIDERTALITEKNGKIFFLIDDKLQEEAIANTPKVLNEGQGGLLDIAVDPDYEKTGWIYLAYSHDLEKIEPGQKNSGAMTRIVRGKIINNEWTKQEVIFEAPHEKYRTTRHHYGSRIVFDHDGYLYFSIGDRGSQDMAQEVIYPNGKIHRIHKDGSIPKDNPFVKTKGAIPSIYSYGHRNPQGISVHPVTGRVWNSEHGPMGGDELNLVKKGANYGWPVITYGMNYDGTPITKITEKEGMEQPVLHWTPSIAVCGIEFYKGNLFPKWDNNLFVGALKYQQLARVVIEDNKVVKEEVILRGHGRIRDVGVSPNGAVYVVSNMPGKILKLTPSNNSTEVESAR